MRDHISGQASSCRCAWNCFLSNSEATRIDDCVYKSKNSDKKPWNGGSRRQGEVEEKRKADIFGANFPPCS